MRNSQEISVETFRQLGSQVVDECCQFLQRDNTIPSKDDITNLSKLLQESLPEQGLGPEAIEDLGIVSSSSVSMIGRWFAYIRSPSDLIGALGDFYASVTNQIVTQWSSSPCGTAIETLTTRWICEALGCPNHEGIFTSGGSVSNLMALTMARAYQMPVIHQEGLYNQSRLVVYASTEVHFTIHKAMSILGLGTNNLRLLQTDNNYHLQARTLKSAIEADRALGFKPMAVVVNAGTINTGAVDPLEELADLAHSEGLWVHADGSYGVMVAIARPDIFKGLEKMDSVSVDAHKLISTPIDCGLLLFKDPEVAKRAFAVNSFMVKSYKETNVIEAHDRFFCEMGIESTRRSRALKLWLSLRYHGLGTIRNSLSHKLEVTQNLAAMIDEHPLLELMAPVQLTIVCCRFRPLSEKSEKILSEINQAINDKITESGEFYVKTTMLGDVLCIRVAILDDRTTTEIAQEFVNLVVKIGLQITGN